jgi:hypothetical protein
MPVGDMTTLANVKAWRTPQIAASADDAQIRREITAASRAILQQLNRSSLSVANIVETRNGQGTQGIMLRNYPVISISSVSVEGQTIAAAPLTSNSGWVFSPSDGMLYLRGYSFPCGVQNITISYRAGFLASGEQIAVPATPFRFNCSDLYEAWASDQGVTYSDGTALTAVASGPTVGQYVAPTSPDGYYQFAAADTGIFLLVSYGYTPRDLEQACIELVCLEYNRRSRIGTTSESLAGQTVSSYTQQGFPSHIAKKLWSYTSVVPN